MVREQVHGTHQVPGRGTESPRGEPPMVRHPVQSVGYQEDLLPGKAGDPGAAVAGAAEEVMPRWPSCHLSL